MKFEKANGEIRLLRGTLKEGLLPEALDETKAYDPDVVTLWDLDAEAWRSFHVGRVISIQ